MGNSIRMCKEQDQTQEAAIVKKRLQYDDRSANGRTKGFLYGFELKCQPGEVVKSGLRMYAESEETCSREGGRRVTVVVRKDELRRLLRELSTVGGENFGGALDDEMKRGREKVRVWRPSLRSITEDQETDTMNDT